MDRRDISDRRTDDEPAPGETPLADIVDAAARRIMTGLMIAGGVIALAVYSRPGPPRYEVDVSGSTVIRTDIRSGTVLACEGQRCYTVVRRGQSLEDGPEEKAALPAPAAPEPKALPAPAPAAQPPAEPQG